MFSVQKFRKQIFEDSNIPAKGTAFKCSVMTCFPSREHAIYCICQYFL